MGDGVPMKSRPEPKVPLLRVTRGRPRSFFEWATLRRWDKLPPWEIDQPGYLLRLAREEAELTQSELAARLGVTQQAVSRAEAWRSNPTVGLLRRWLAACGWRMRIEAEPLRACERRDGTGSEEPRPKTIRATR